MYIRTCRLRGIEIQMSWAKNCQCGICYALTAITVSLSSYVVRIRFNRTPITRTSIVDRCLSSCWLGYSSYRTKPRDQLRVKKSEPRVPSNWVIVSRCCTSYAIGTNYICFNFPSGTDSAGGVINNVRVMSTEVFGTKTDYGITFTSYSKTHLVGRQCRNEIRYNYERRWRCT